MSSKNRIVAQREDTRANAKQKERVERQAAGLPALTDEEQQQVMNRIKSKEEGFFNPDFDNSRQRFGSNVLVDQLNKNKSGALTAIPQYDLSANSAYRQQMSLRKVRGANKL